MRTAVLVRTRCGRTVPWWSWTARCCTPSAGPRCTSSTTTRWPDSSSRTRNTSSGRAGRCPPTGTGSCRPFRPARHRGSPVNRLAV